MRTPTGWSGNTSRKGATEVEITEADINQATARLNNRPRKGLNYRTPQQVFFKEQKIALTT
jgi:IS30 family transposase